MAEYEDLAYQMKHQPPIDYSLITPERTAKLELFIHLLHNTTHPIVLCGTKGVGKTTLLNVFRQQHNESWQICSIKGKADLTFEQIQDQLLAVCPSKQSLVDFFEKLAIQDKKLVVIIDDAGCLAPYLISSMIDYSAPHAVLKLVFVLNHDELALKTHSDSTIESCHVIEIPPLSESQCGDFLQHLAIKSTLKVPIHGITDSMIASFYQKTHGIPAAIIAQLPILARPQKNTKTARWLLVILLGLFFAGLVLVILLDNSPLSSLLKSLINR